MLRTKTGGQRQEDEDSRNAERPALQHITEQADKVGRRAAGKGVGSGELDKRAE